MTTSNISNIEKYVAWMNLNPKKVNKKVRAVYEFLLRKIHEPQCVEYVDADGNIKHKVFVFDIAKAQRPIGFFEQFLKHSKGKWAGQPVKLELWQKALIEAIFGFVDQETGFRQYTKVNLFVAKKNGKSTLAAGLGLYMLTSDGEGGAEVYSVAKIRDQAKLIWTEAKRMINKSPALKKRLRSTINGIYYDKKDAHFMPLASQVNSLDGKNSSCVLADEIWAWEDLGLLTIMEDGTSSRNQPLFFETSTMGPVRGKVFDHEYEYAERLIKGILGESGGITTDYNTLAIIYEMNRIKDIDDEECWYQANPNLGVSKNLDYLRNKVQKSKDNPQDLSNILCKEFNIRQTTSQAWLSYSVLNIEDTYDEDEWRDAYVIGGCDLSSTTDLTCATIIGLKRGRLLVKQMYWIPQELADAKVKLDKIPYDIWQKLGWMRFSEGFSVDYHDITQWFIEQVNKYKLRPLWIGYDKWSASYWASEMKECGFDLYEVIQGARTMSQPMKKLKADLMARKINYNNNPVLKWCLSNLSIKSDENENIRPVKDKSTQRIDGAVSLIDAYVLFCEHELEYTQLIERKEKEAGEYS